jgi:hypothetical protein
MYLLDPERGRNRRAVIKDKATSTATGIGQTVSSTSRDLASRANGIMRATGSLASGISDRATALVGSGKKTQSESQQSNEIQPQAH